jgi:hypothetical protein
MRQIALIGALAIGFAALLGAAPAHADGEVTRAKGCGEKIFVSSVNGFSVLSGPGEGMVKDGDMLVGDLELIGHAAVYDKTAGRNVFVMIEEHGLDKSQITQRIAAACRSEVANTFTSGQVMRTRGCGNKIFVDATNGFAVLERISGGIVNEGDTVSGNFNRAGRATVQVKQSGITLTVFVDDFELSRSAIRRKIAATCR